MIVRISFENPFARTDVYADINSDAESDAEAEQAKAFVDEYLENGEYVVIEFDTDAKTARVCKANE